MDTKPSQNMEKGKDVKKIRNVLAKYKNKSSDLSNQSIDKQILNTLFSLRGDNNQITETYQSKHDLIE